MANNDPPPGIKNNYIRPDDADIVLAYQLAGTGPRDKFCPRCLREANFLHRGRWTIACEDVCLLCGRGGHKGAPCPEMLTVLGKAWLDGHWADHREQLSGQDLQDALEVARQTTGRTGNNRLPSQGPKQGEQGGSQQQSISQSQPTERGQPSKKRPRADDEPKSLADAPKLDPQKDARQFYKQCISLKMRALKQQQALFGGEESSRKVQDLEAQISYLKTLCDKREEELKTSFAETSQLQLRHDRQMLDQRLKYENLKLQRDTLAAQYQSLEKQLKKTQADYAAFVEQSNADHYAKDSTISDLRREIQRLSTEHSKYSILYKDAKKENNSLATENATLRETAERSANPDVAGNSQQVPPPRTEVKQEQPTQQLVEAPFTPQEHHYDDVDAKPQLADEELVGYEGDEEDGGGGR
jgi:hypothetical protein